MSDEYANLPDCNPATDKKMLGYLAAGGVAVGLATGLAAGLILPRLRQNKRSGGLQSPARVALGLAGEVGLALAMRALSHKLEQTDTDAAKPATEPDSTPDVKPAPSPSHGINWRDTARMVVETLRKRNSNRP